MKREEYGEVMAKLRQQGIEAKLVQVKKNNGVIFDGIRIGSERIQPVIYPEQIETVDECVDICKSALLTNYENQFNIGDFTNYENVRKRLSIRLTTNPGDDLVCWSVFCDIFATAFVILDGGGFIHVKNEHLKLWKVTKEQFIFDACSSAKLITPAVMAKLEDVLLQLLPDERFSGGIPMMVITNNLKIFGASAILYANDLPEKFIMLPSSIHEVLLLTEDIESVKERLKEFNLVEVINRDHLDPVDVLSNHAYYFKKGVWETI